MRHCHTLDRGLPPIQFRSCEPLYLGNDVQRSLETNHHSRNFSCAYIHSIAPSEVRLAIVYQPMRIELETTVKSRLCPSVIQWVRLSVDDHIRRNDLSGRRWRLVMANEELLPIALLEIYCRWGIVWNGYCCDNVWKQFRVFINEYYISIMWGICWIYNCVKVAFYVVFF